MNSNYGKNFDFDLGTGSSRNVSLNDQKNNKTSSTSSYSSAQPKPAWQPNKPSWTHQPAAPTTTTNTTNQSLPGGATSSMVGDIFGKSWSSSNPGSGIGIVDKNPNLFGDLVNSALGQQGNSKNSNSLRNTAPAKNNTKPSFSMGNVADSLPKNSNSSMNWGGSSVNYSKPNPGGSSSTKSSSNNVSGIGMGVNGIGGGVGIGSSKPKDPFGSLVDFGSKPINNNLKSGTKTSKANDFDDTGFGDFLNAPKPSPSFNLDDFAAKPVNRNTFPASNNNPNPSFGMDDFAKPATGNAFSGFNNKSFNMDDFTKPGTQVHPSDQLDSLFTPTNNGFEGGQSEMDDWGTEAELGGGGDGGTTTELDGLPPPPAGVNASAAKSKGMDNYRQGQYADAIKWLSWAVVLLEKSGEKGTIVEVLASRASCYKEVGEYKKAVADCTKVLERDDKNVSVLVQRALLYESMEKYRLGAEDLRTVLKIDPSNRLARNTVHRLSKLSD